MQEAAGGGEGGLQGAHRANLQKASSGAQGHPYNVLFDRMVLQWGPHAIQTCSPKFSAVQSDEENIPALSLTGTVTGKTPTPQFPGLLNGDNT